MFLLHHAASIAANGPRIDYSDVQIVSLANVGEFGWDGGQTAAKMLSQLFCVDLDNRR